MGGRHRETDRHYTVSETVMTPMKLAIRTDEAAGLIRGFFRTMDDSASVEIGTISLVAARNDNQFFRIGKTLSPPT